MSLINYIGIKESARYNDISTIIESFGLVAIIALGLYYMKSESIFSSMSFFESPAGVSGIFAATTIVYFAFMGFENLVNISEEAKNAKKIIPKALLISLVVSSLIYILVSISAVGVLGSEQLSKSKAPLAEVAERVIPNSSVALSLIALFATSNTVLILLIVASRLLYGLSSNNLLPPIFSAIGKRGTPFISVMTVGALAGTSLFIGDIKKLAHLVDLGIFAVYIFVNLSLIILRYREPHAKRAFKSPLNIGNFPILALLGILLNLGMFYFFDFRTFIYGILLFGAGIAAYFVFNPDKERK
jgi:APA family basic amino acid/polyamine antiporter